MKKRILLLSVAGVAAGLLYALESNRHKHATADDKPARELDPSGNDRALAASAGNAKNSDTPVGQPASRDNGKSLVPEGEARREINDQGMDQTEASNILREIRDNAFDASNEKLALALGRPIEEIEQSTREGGWIDGDVVMKARALAMQRGLKLE